MTNKYYTNIKYWELLFSVLPSSKHLTTVWSNKGLVGSHCRKNIFCFWLKSIIQIPLESSPLSLRQKTGKRRKICQKVICFWRTKGINCFEKWKYLRFIFHSVLTQLWLGFVVSPQRISRKDWLIILLRIHYRNRNDTEFNQTLRPLPTKGRNNECKLELSRISFLAFSNQFLQLT